MGTRKTLITHIKRSPYQAAVAVITMFITFLLTGAFFLMSLSSAAVLAYFETKPQITVFFTDKATEEEAQTLKRTLEQTGKVTSVTYVSKEEALAIYQEQNKSDPLLLEMVTADILPASLEVSAADPLYLEELAPLVKDAAGVEEVVYQKDVVDALITWTRALRMVGGIFVGLFTLNAFLVVMIVIGMKIALRRDSVEILTLVGASPWYVRAPFLLEGGFYGVFGATGAGLLLVGIILWGAPYLLSFLGDIVPIAAVLSQPASVTFLALAAIFVVGLAVIGFFLGVAASWVALTRFLKF